MTDYKVRLENALDAVERALDEVRGRTLPDLGKLADIAALCAEIERKGIERRGATGIQQDAEVGELMIRVIGRLDELVLEVSTLAMRDDRAPPDGTL